MTDSAQLEDFRARCKAFLDEHATGIDYAVGESRAAASIAAAKPPLKDGFESLRLFW